MKRIMLILAVILSSLLVYGILTQDNFYTNEFNDTNKSYQFTLEDFSNITYYIDVLKYSNVTTISLTLNSLNLTSTTWSDDTEDSSAEIGNVANLANAVDEDWSTYASMPDAGDTILENFTIPNQASSARFIYLITSSVGYPTNVSCYNSSGIWQNIDNFNAFTATRSVDIPTSCFNNPIQTNITKATSVGTTLYRETMMNWTGNRSATDIYFEVGTPDGNYEWNNNGYSNGTYQVDLNATNTNKWLATCTENANGECQLPILYGHNYSGQVNLSNLNVSITTYSANWSFNNSLDGGIITPTCTRNVLYAFNFTNWLTNLTWANQNASCTLTGYVPYTESWYGINVTELKSMTPYAGYLNFSDTVQGIVYPLSGLVMNFSGTGIVLDKTDYDEGEQINVEFWKTGSAPNTTKQQYQFLNTLTANINQTISMSQSASEYIYFRVVDKANNPLEDALITIYHGYANATGYEYALSNQLLTDSAGYAFANLDTSEQIRLTVLADSYGLYERIFNADDETPRALADAMLLVMNENSTFKSDWSKIIFIV